MNEQVKIIKLNSKLYFIKNIVLRSITYTGLLWFEIDSLR